MANSGEQLVSKWIDQQIKETGRPVQIDRAIEWIRGEIRDLKVLIYVQTVAHQSRADSVAILDELVVKLSKWEALPAMFEEAARELHHSRGERRAA